MAVAARLPARLSSSDRPTPQNALQSWVDRHIQVHSHVDSQQALQDLQGQWRTQGLPHPHPQQNAQEEASQWGEGRLPGCPPGVPRDWGRFS